MKTEDRYLAILSHVEALARQYGRDPSELTVICVSKNHTWDEMESIQRAGCRNFGESRVQEALEKMDAAPEADLQWHLIGTLQKNKIGKVIGKFSLVHSVDQLDLAIKISEASVQNQIKTPILLQVNTSGEETKHGAAPQQWLHDLGALLVLPGIELKGLMTMAPLTKDQKRIRKTFADLRIFRDQLEQEMGRTGALPQLSMGMSNDYPLAIAEGATLLRIGSAIFKTGDET